MTVHVLAVFAAELLAGDTVLVRIKFAVTRFHGFYRISTSCIVSAFRKGMRALQCQRKCKKRKNDFFHGGENSQFQASSGGAGGRGRLPPVWPALLPDEIGPEQLGAPHLPGPASGGGQTPGDLLRQIRVHLPACWEARPGDQLEGGAMSSL